MSYRSKKTLELEFLKDLIEIYERRWYSNSTFKNSVSIKINKEKYSKYFKDQTLSDLVLNELCKKNFIYIKKIKYRDINESFHLNLEKIEEVYEYLEKTHPQNYFDKLIETFDKYSCVINDIKKNEFLSTYNDGKSIKSYLTSEFLDLVKVSYYIFINEEEIYERNFSNQVFNDSKKLELLKGQIFNYFNDDNILIEKGIIRNPTYLYIKGEGQIIINNQTIDLSVLKYPIGLPSTAIQSIKFNNITKVYSIENLTTFNYFNEEGLIIYLGGFSNQHKIDLLRKVKESTTDFYHFGDIDYGGFSILDNLISNLGVDVKAYNMSLKELDLYKDNLIKISDNSYIERLKTLLNKENLRPYFKVIEYLINNKVKLEQESVVNSYNL